jgi:hypothetical protein
MIATMTIEEWNILLSSVILVLMTGGGIWLKYVVEQQLKSKDTAIQALEGVVKLKDAHIASLEGNTAPHIAKAYADMREHANLMSGLSQGLSAQLEELSKRHQSEKEMLLPKIILGEVHGLQFASELLSEKVWKLIVPDGQTVDTRYLDDEYDPLLDGIGAVTVQINQRMKAELERGSKMANNIKLLVE